MTRGRSRLVFAVTSLLLLGAGGLLAQPAGFNRTIVGRGDVSVAGREAVVAKIEVAAGARSGRHTHPGDEISYVLEGEVELAIDGQPVRIVRAGESFVVPAGTVHEAHNRSATTARVIGVYVVDKGKPLATPAP